MRRERERGGGTERWNREKGEEEKERGRSWRERELELENFILQGLGEGGREKKREGEVGERGGGGWGGEEGRDLDTSVHLISSFPQILFRHKKVNA